MPQKLKKNIVLYILISNNYYFDSFTGFITSCLFDCRYIEISADEMKNILAAIRKPPPHATPMELLKEVTRIS